MSRECPQLPVDQLHAALPSGHEAKRGVDALHRELESPTPNPSVIRRLASELEQHAPIAAIVANWFDDPRTQEFINALVQAGL